MIGLSFFSGALGLDLGIEEAGFNVRLYCENDPACQRTIKANRPETPFLDDIAELDAATVRSKAGLSKNDDVDLVFGGPPCQAFSSAGTRKGFSDSRGNLFLTFLELAVDLSPRCIVIENVRGLLSAQMVHENGNGVPGSAMNHVLDVLQDAGYSTSFNLYNTANFGAPQIRERVIILCCRENYEFPYLMPTHHETGDYGLSKWRTFGDAVRELKIAEHTYVEFPKERIKYYKYLSAGQNWRSLPENVQKEAMGNSYFAGGGKTGFFRRLSWDRPAPTLVTHPAMKATDLAHPVENRPLSIEEYKRVQDFPDSWKVEGTLIDQYRQVGNAVPVSLGQAIGESIKSYLVNGHVAHPPDGFRFSRYKNTDTLSWKVLYDEESRRLELGGRQLALAT